MAAKSQPGPSILLMLLIYAGLLLLLILTVVAAHFPLGPIALLIALAIAAAKSIMVILFYMHVRYSSRVTWIFVISGFIWLMILFSLTFGEYVGRAGLTRAQPLPTHHVIR